MERSDLRNKLSNVSSGDVLETNDLRSRLSSKRASDAAAYWNRSLSDITLTVGQIGRRFEHVEELEDEEDPGLHLINNERRKIPVDLREKIHTSHGPPIRLAVGDGMISEAQIGRAPIVEEDELNGRQVVIQNEPRVFGRPRPSNSYFRSKNNAKGIEYYETTRYKLDNMVNNEVMDEDYDVDHHFEERRLYFKENLGYRYPYSSDRRRPMYSSDKFGYFEDEMPAGPMYAPKRVRSYQDPHDSNERYYSSNRFVYEETEIGPPPSPMPANDNRYFPPYQTDLRRDLDSRHYDNHHQQEIINDEQFKSFGDDAQLRDPYESFQERSNYLEQEHFDGASGVYFDGDDAERKHHYRSRSVLPKSSHQHENQHFQQPSLTYSPQYDGQQNYNSYGEGEQDPKSTQNFGLYCSRAPHAAAENSGYLEENPEEPHPQSRDFEQGYDFMGSHKQLNQTRQSRNNKTRRQRKLETKRSSQNHLRKEYQQNTSSIMHVKTSTAPSDHKERRPFTEGPPVSLPLEINNRSNDEPFLSDPDPAVISSHIFIQPSGPSKNRDVMAMGPMLLSGEDPFNPEEANQPSKKNMTINNNKQTKNQIERKKNSQEGNRGNDHNDDYSGTSSSGFTDFMNGKTRDEHIEIIKEVRKNTTTNTKQAVARSRSPKDDPKKIKNSNRKRRRSQPNKNHNSERSGSPNQNGNWNWKKKDIAKAREVLRNLSPPSPPRSPSPMIKQNALAVADKRRTSRSPPSYFRDEKIRESPRRYRNKSPEQRRESPTPQTNTTSKRFAPLPLNLDSPNATRNEKIRESPQRYRNRSPERQTPYVLSPRTEHYSKIREKQCSWPPELSSSVPPASPPRLDLSPPPLNIPKQRSELSRMDSRYNNIDHTNVNDKSKSVPMYEKSRGTNPRSSTFAQQQQLKNKVCIDYHHLKDPNEVLVSEASFFSKPKGSLLGFVSEKMLAKSQPLTKADDMMHTWRLAGHNEESLMNKIREWHPPTRTKLKIHLIDEMERNANSASMPLNISLSELLDLTVDFFMPNDRINLLEGRLTNASREFERMLETTQPIQQMAGSSSSSTRNCNDTFSAKKTLVGSASSGTNLASSSSSSSGALGGQDHSTDRSTKMEKSLRKLNQLSSMLDLQIGPPHSEDRRSFEIRMESFDPLRVYIVERMRKDAGKYGITESYIQKSSQAIVKVLAVAKFSIPLMRHHLSSYGIKSLADLISSKITMYEPNFPGGISSNYIVRLTLDYIEEFHH